MGLEFELKSKKEEEGRGMGDKIGISCFKSFEGCLKFKEMGLEFELKSKKEEEGRGMGDKIGISCFKSF
jgi:hypothetical protein